MTSDEIKAVLAGLARKGPVFHSEADFQLALGWQIQRRHKLAQVRLEKRPFPRDGERARWALDVEVTIDGKKTAIELKYLKRRLTYTDPATGEVFSVVDQAQDVDRYEAIRDVARVEAMVDAGYAAGFVIILSNDPAHWTPPATPMAAGALRIHEGHVLSGAAFASAPIPDGRQLTVRSTMPLAWEPYATVTSGGSGAVEFRCLIIPVNAVETSTRPHLLCAGGPDDTPGQNAVTVPAEAVAPVEADSDADHAHRLSEPMVGHLYSRRCNQLTFPGRGSRPSPSRGHRGSGERPRMP